MCKSNSYKGHIVDLVGRRIFGGEFVVRDGKIDSVTECKVDERAPYYMPGFIDSHIHIESSMMTPVEFAKVALSHGTTSAVCDPHEIANVLGTEGIDLMINLAGLCKFRFIFGMPSCVPSCNRDIETSGCILGSNVVSEYLKRDDIRFLSEMMNFPGVLAGDSEVMAKIAAAKAVGKPIDGHAPALVGDGRRSYAAAGVSTDHECNSIETGRSAIESGMYVQIREGSASKDYAALAPLIAEAPGRIMFCTDDCHPDDYVKGHINNIVKRAISEGYDLMDILSAACLTPVRHYGIPTGLLQQGDAADFIVLGDLSSDFRVLSTYIDGERLYSSEGEPCASYLRESAESVDKMLGQEGINVFNAKPIKVEDIAKAPEKEESIIVASDGSLFTIMEKGPVTEDVQKIVVLDRYTLGAVPQIAYIKGFNISHGALAQSIAHDCHNIVAVGNDDEQIVKVMNRVIEMKGGIAVSDGSVMEDLPLPIAGILSPLNCESLSEQLEKLNRVVKAAGCEFRSPFITLSFMCLPVIPQIKLTDKGLVQFT